MWVCPWLLPLQNSSPSLSVTVAESRLFPQMAQRKQVLCQGCSSREGTVKRLKTGNPRHKTMSEERLGGGGSHLPGSLHHLGCVDGSGAAGAAVRAPQLGKLGGGGRRSVRLRAGRSAVAG